MSVLGAVLFASKLNQERLCWRPVQRGLIRDLEQRSYFLERSRYAKAGQC